MTDIPGTTDATFGNRVISFGYHSLKGNEMKRFDGFFSFSFFG